MTFVPFQNGLEVVGEQARHRAVGPDRTTVPGAFRSARPPPLIDLRPALHWPAMRPQLPMFRGALPTALAVASMAACGALYTLLAYRFSPIAAVAPFVVAPAGLLILSQPILGVYLGVLATPFEYLNLRLGTAPACRPERRSTSRQRPVRRPVHPGQPDHRPRRRRNLRRGGRRHHRVPAGSRYSREISIVPREIVDSFEHQTCHSVVRSGHYESGPAAVERPWPMTPRAEPDA